MNNKCCLSAVPCAHTSNKASDESEDDLDEDGISEPSIKYPLRRMCTPIKLPWDVNADRTPSTLRIPISDRCGKQLIDQVISFEKIIKNKVKEDNEGSGIVIKRESWREVEWI